MDESRDEEQDGDQIETTASHQNPLQQPDKSQTAIWTDPDDETLRISISSDNRLRKLRKDPNEDIILGSEYEKRLRKQ
jgi:U3 small nucleolar RNA-associated protein 18